MQQALGLYLSVPFCRAKCTFCNFASDAYSPALLPGYLEALAHEIAGARGRAADLGVECEERVDTVYFGGGTPSLLAPDQIQGLFTHLRSCFAIARDAEITVECAPGQISQESLEQFVREGVNRLSFGVQSFVAEELRQVGRTHTPETCVLDLRRARDAGIERLSVDLIAGMPRQTSASWERSLDAVLTSGVGHVSVYMLEVDSGSRLGREVLDDGVRYGARHVPADDECVALYETACERLSREGIEQYEISNFARVGEMSVHNLKYWTRAPYLGFGVDAHSMLPGAVGDAIRFWNDADLHGYIAGKAAGSQGLWVCAPAESKEGGPQSRSRRVGRGEALEESILLGLRLNAGMDLDLLAEEFGEAPITAIAAGVQEAREAGLLWKDERAGRRYIGLTLRGRATANEVLVRLLTGLETSRVNDVEVDCAVA